MQDPLDGLSASDYPKLGTKLGQDGADSEVMKSDMRLQNEQFRETMGARKKQGVALFLAEVRTLAYRRGGSVRPPGMDCIALF